MHTVIFTDLDSWASRKYLLGVVVEKTYTDDERHWVGGGQFQSVETRVIYRGQDITHRLNPALLDNAESK